MARSVVPLGDITERRNCSGLRSPWQAMAAAPRGGVQGQLLGDLGRRPSLVPAWVMASISRKK